MAANLTVVDPKKKAKSEVVEEAKTILKLAEEGKIIDLSWAAARIDGYMLTSFTGTLDSMRRLGAVSRLLYRLQALPED